MTHSEMRIFLLQLPYSSFLRMPGATLEIRLNLMRNISPNYPDQLRTLQENEPNRFCFPLTSWLTQGHGHWKWYTIVKYNDAYISIAGTKKAENSAVKCSTLKFLPSKTNSKHIWYTDLYEGVHAEVPKPEIVSCPTEHLKFLPCPAESMKVLNRLRKAGTQA